MSQQEIAQLPERKAKLDQLTNRLPAAVSKLKELIGKPWIHQGRDIELGVDCAGLVVYYGKLLGYNVEQVPADYPRVVDPSILYDNLAAHCSLADINELELGDILLMRWSTTPQHLAIYTGDDWMIHSYEKHGVTMQQLNPFWKKRIVNVFRVI